MEISAQLTRMQESIFNLGKTRLHVLDDGKAYHSVKSKCKGAADFPKKVVFSSKALDKLCPSCGADAHFTATSAGASYSLKQAVAANAEFREKLEPFLELKEASLEELSQTIALMEMARKSDPKHSFNSYQTFSVRHWSLGSDLGWSQIFEAEVNRLADEAVEFVKTERSDEALNWFAKFAFMPREPVYGTLFKNFHKEELELAATQQKRAATDRRLFLLVRRGRGGFAERTGSQVLIRRLYTVAEDMLVVPAAVAELLNKGGSYECARIAKKDCRPEVYETVKVFFKPDDEGPYSKLSGALKGATKV